MHDDILTAAFHAPHLSHVSPFRIEDNGCFTLLVADVFRSDTDPSHIGQVWIGGDVTDDEFGMSGYTQKELLGDGNPATSEGGKVETVRGIVEAITRTASAVREAASWHNGDVVQTQQPYDDVPVTMVRIAGYWQAITPKGNPQTGYNDTRIEEFIAEDRVRVVIRQDVTA